MIKACKEKVNRKLKKSKKIFIGKNEQQKKTANIAGQKGM